MWLKNLGKFKQCLECRTGSVHKLSSEFKVFFLIPKTDDMVPKKKSLRLIIVIELSILTDLNNPACTYSKALFSDTYQLKCFCQ